jgi:hypothetical protein
MYNIKNSAAIYTDSQCGRTRFEHRTSYLKKSTSHEHA